MARVHHRRGRSFLSGSPYEDAPIIPVSSRTGNGIAELKEAIDRSCDTVVRNKTMGTMRLPVDRVFSIRGAGTIVTGTLWSGTVKVDDTVEILPELKTCRVRSVQIHGLPQEMAHAGNRVALGLNGIGTDEVRPGDLIATPGTIVASDRFDAYLTYRDTAETGKSLESGSLMHIAHGTREVVGRVLFDDGLEQLEPGMSTFAQIRLEESLPVSYRDRFIIRTYSPMRVAGGGMVLLAHPRRRTNLTPFERILLEDLRTGDHEDAVTAALRLEDAPVSASELADFIGLDTDEVRISSRTSAPRGAW